MSISRDPPPHRRPADEAELRVPAAVRDLKLLRQIDGEIGLHHARHLVPIHGLHVEREQVGLEIPLGARHDDRRDRLLERHHSLDILLALIPERRDISRFDGELIDAAHLPLPRNDVCEFRGAELVERRDPVVEIGARIAHVRMVPVAQEPSDERDPVLRNDHDAVARRMRGSEIPEHDLDAPEVDFRFAAEGRVRSRDPHVPDELPGVRAVFLVELEIRGRILQERGARFGARDDDGPLLLEDHVSPRVIGMIVRIHDVPDRRARDGPDRLEKIVREPRRISRIDHENAVVPDDEAAVRAETLGCRRPARDHRVDPAGELHETRRVHVLLPAAGDGERAEQDERKDISGKPFDEHCYLASVSGPDARAPKSTRSPAP